MKTGKQVLCFLLALALLAGLLPATVQPVQAVEAEPSAVESTVDLEPVDHSEDADTATEEIEPTRVPEAGSSQEEKTFYKFSFSFSIPSANARVFVGDEDMGTSFDVEEGSDVTFRIVARGYKVGVLLYGGRPFQPNADGSYTVSNVRSNCSFTVMLAKAEAEGAEVTFRCTNAKVTVGGVDYTDGTYSHPGGALNFTVEIPAGYYVQSVKATPDQDICCGSEVDQKIQYTLVIESNGGHDVTVDIVAAEGMEADTWPLTYRYTMNGPGQTYATIQACSPAYVGDLELPGEVIHNGVPFEVRHIGDYAFMECYTLTGLSMEDTVVTVGEYAFSCTSIKNIKLSRNITQIGESCFLKSIYLEKVTIPERLTAIPKYAFDSCYNLKVVELPDSLQSIGENAFWDCIRLPEITIPARVREIAEGTFMGCEGLERVTFLGPVTSIGRVAFYNAKSLKHIDLPDTLTYLGEAAFECTYKNGEEKRGLEEIVIPAGVAEIQDDTFLDCYNLKSVTFLGNVTSIGDDAFQNTESLQEIELPESVRVIGEGAFQGSGLRRILIPKECAEIGVKAFAVTELKAFEVDPGNTTYQVGDDGVLYSKNGKRLVLYPSDKSETVYTMRVGTEQVDAYAFAGVRNLEQIVFPEGLREIGDSAFAGLPKLKKVTLPEGLQDITSDSAFFNCKLLDEVHFPETIIDIGGDSVFQNTGIKILILPDSLQDISGSNVFSGCEKIESILFGSGISKITGERNFADTTGLNALEIPDNLMIISGDVNFYGSGIKHLILPEGMQEISGEGNFGKCENLTEVMLPESLHALGRNSFYGCVALERVKLPSKLEKLEASVFRMCSKLKTIEIPESVTSIGDRCFCECESLTTVEIPCGVKSIGTSSFEGCTALNSIKLPIGLEHVGDLAFAATGITTLSVPETVTSWGVCPIGATRMSGGYIFDYDRTYVVYFAGDIPAWETSNYPLPNVRNLHCYFPQNNSTWTDCLKYLIDGPLFCNIHWNATDVSLPASLELTAGMQQQLSEAVKPVNDPNLPLTWTSSDEAIVQVDDTGVLTGMAPGTAVITVTAGDGAYCAQCQVTVREKVKPYYQDVSEDAWYYEAVQYTSERNLFRGITETKFGPNLTMNRGMLVTVLYRMEGEPSVEGLTHSFTDVSANRYYTDAVAWAASQGLIQGMTETRFAPEAEVTREQMVTILYRYAGMKGADLTARGDLSRFPDGDQVQNYAKEAFSWAVGAGIIQGTVNGGVTTLAPRSSSTRAQVAAVLMRYLQNVG